jgi:magnesium transporter
VISVSTFDAAGTHKLADPEQISDLLKIDKTVVWADLVRPTAEDLALVESEFDLHPLAIEDSSKHGQRPKLELYENHAFLVLYASTNEHQSLSEVDVFVGSNWIVTVHEHTDADAHFDTAVVRARCERTAPENVEVSFVLYTVLDEIVDSYFGTVERLGDQIDAIEEKIFGDENPEVDERPIQREMLDIRKDLLEFRRRVVPLREVLLMLLRDDLDFVTEESRHYYQDILDHVMRVTDEIDNRRELIGNAVDAHLAMVSNQMNLTMKKMTSWGAILIVATLISGVFGMNFDDTPILHYQNGFAGAVTVMVVLTGLFYLYFRRKHWL